LDVIRRAVATVANVKACDAIRSTERRSKARFQTEATTFFAVGFAGVRIIWASRVKLVPVDWLGLIFFELIERHLYPFEQLR